MLWDKTQYIN